jgi:hypothetical protein
MELQTLTPADLFYFIMGEDVVWIEFIEIAFGWGPGHIWLHITLEGPWPHYMILEGVLGRPLDTYFWVLTLSWSRLLARVRSAPKTESMLFEFAYPKYANLLSLFVSSFRV